jgi:hypothetical protein
VVETIRLESGHTLTGIVGSNPTLSAILFAFPTTMRLDSDIIASLKIPFIALSGPDWKIKG